jgi:hypothetical protein
MRNAIVAMLLLVLAGIEAWAWNQFRHGSESSPATANMALMTHLAVALAAAILGSFWLKQARFSTRATLVVLFVILAAILPVGGVIIVALVAYILATPAGDGLRPEDKFVFGNPQAVAARRESRQKDVEIRPLAEAMRSFDVHGLESMIHGLRHLQPPRLTRHFLRRFQIDPQSNLQFAAQGVITSNLERLESQLKTVLARIAEAPNDAASRLAAGEILLELADWTPIGDATAQVYRQDAMQHLQILASAQPENDQVWERMAKALVGLNDPASALVALSRISQREPSSLLLEMEAHFLSGQFEMLPDLAKELGAAQTPVAYEPLGFWSGEIDPPASMKPRAA